MFAGWTIPGFVPVLHRTLIGTRQARHELDGGVAVTEIPA